MTFLDTDTTHYTDALYLACSEWPGLPGAAAVSGLLTVRNIGNLVPTDPAEGSVDAALDHAINHLQVRTIVVCGHSGCGAMASLLSVSIDTPTSPVSCWLDYARDALVAFDEFHLARVGAAANGFSQADQLAVVNVVIQVERLARHPILAGAIVSGRLRIAGTFYNAQTGRVHEVTASGIPIPGAR
ncbi:carbonic anhydrase [Mycobacteroides franklinii]|nr:carbonic anhydrase [Mycobacteroides franklinii]